MKMQDWSNKLDDFLELSEYDILTHAGKISAEQAKLKAKEEYDKYRRVIDSKSSQVDQDLTAAIKRLNNK